MSFIFYKSINMVNLEPCPCVDETIIFPPCSSNIFLVKYSPIPDPSESLTISELPLKNLLNTFPNSLLGIPIPLSSISIFMYVSNFSIFILTCQPCKDK